MSKQLTTALPPHPITFASFWCVIFEIIGMWLTSTYDRNTQKQTKKLRIVSVWNKKCTETCTKTDTKQ